MLAHGVWAESLETNDLAQATVPQRTNPWGDLLSLLTDDLPQSTEPPSWSPPRPLIRTNFVDAPLRYYGLLWQDYELPLEHGMGREVLGPFFGFQETSEHRTWRISPFYSQYTDEEVEQVEREFLYPLLTLDRFGTEWRFQILQFLSFAGGNTVDDEVKRRQTLFPIYFRQTSTEPTNNYFGIIPFYGRVQNRFFRDESRWILFPVYVQTHKKGVVTDNYLLPFFHLRHGAGVEGWQLWPLVGKETREIGSRTNIIDEPEVVPGHERNFILWPFFIHEKAGLGTDNPRTNWYAFPFYLKSRSPNSDYTWITTFTSATNRVEQYQERFFPWPFIGIARGPGKTMDRYFPLIGRAERPGLRSSFVLWPFFTRRELMGESLYRRRDRLAFYLYNDLLLQDTETGDSFRRRDLLPLYTWRRAPDGKTRLQILAPIEPFLPNNKSIQRLYSPMWALWRDEQDPANERRSQSLLWNLWRRDVAPDIARTGTLFGAVQTVKTAAGRSWRFFGFPREKRGTNTAVSSREVLSP
jgi:hypothetical protein